MRVNPIRLTAISLFAAAMGMAYIHVDTKAALTDAAQNFLATLAREQRTKTTFKMEDDERLNWHFTPVTRKGLSLNEMDKGQRAMAEALLATALSAQGLRKAAEIRNLQEVLRVQELNNPNFTRDAEDYYFSIFGTPSTTGTWAFRFEGHHIALNYTVANGKIVASPTFFGTNPAEIKEGPRKGFRALPVEEDEARALLKSLDQKEQSAAWLDKTAPRDIISAEKRKADPLDPKGLAASAMTAAQRDMLMTLIQEYAYNMPADLAEDRMKQVNSAGPTNIYFAWLGGADKGDGHYYRVQGPTFLIEYDNTQNNANHIHSVWREYHGDFGEDLLAAHYRQYRHDAVLASR